MQTAEYSFIKTNEHLGKYVILLGLAGSYSYGTDVAASDTDIRGITLNRKSDLIGLTRFEQYVDDHTDTVIYAFNKIVTLLLNCNPNTIELLGLKPEHYLYLNDTGRMLLDNRKLFLSKRAVSSFGGYADAQLRRLQNALARDTFPQSEKERHIFNSVKNAMRGFNAAYKYFHEYLLGDMVSYKKFFYVLRPVLACKWIEERKCAPPVLFDELSDAVLEDEMKAAVRDLLAKKVNMSESDRAPRIAKVDRYLEKKLAYYKALAETMEDDCNPDWEVLEEAFREVVLGKE